MDRKGVPTAHASLRAITSISLYLLYVYAIVTSTSTPASILIMIRTSQLQSEHSDSKSSSGNLLFTSKEDQLSQSVSCEPSSQRYPSSYYPHHKCVPRRDFEMYCRQADGTLHPKILRIGAVDELRTDFLEGLDVMASEVMGILWTFCDRGKPFVGSKLT